MKKMKTWHDICLGKAIKIINYKYLEDPDYLENEINLLSILEDKTVDEITNMSGQEIVELFNQYSFIKTLPEITKKYVGSVKLPNYGKVHLKEFNKLSLGDMIDIEEYIKDGIVKNYHNILAKLFYKKKFDWRKLRYYVVEDDFNKKSANFLETPFPIVYEILNFFLSIVEIYTKHLADSSTMEIMKNEMKRVQKIEEQSKS